MEAKVTRKCHVSFFSPRRRRLARLLSAIYVIFRIGPGVGVGDGVGAGVGVDQEPGVVAGVGVVTAPPRLHTPDANPLF